MKIVKVIHERIGVLSFCSNIFLNICFVCSIFRLRLTLISYFFANFWNLCKMID
ncbi:hypothetical protein Hdeb2414_s0027g00695011 [Helianthus debilis subsp. tardiflorus]